MYSARVIRISENKRGNSNTMERIDRIRKDFYKDEGMEATTGTKSKIQNPKSKIGYDPSAEEISAVKIQSYVCWLLLLPFGGFLVLLMLLKGYRIKNIRETRAEFKKIIAENKGRPLLICSNHLTFIDSALIIWGLASNWWFVRNYRVFPWNLPAGDFFKKKLKYHLTLYLTKCIFIHRDGTGEHKNAILGLCRFLLKRGHTVLVFPEGQRSRKGYLRRRKYHARGRAAGFVARKPKSFVPPPAQR